MKRLFAVFLMLLNFTMVFVSCAKPRELSLRTDKEPIENTFKLLNNFKSCYWITDNEKKNRSDPTEDIWFQGYIVLSDEQFSHFLDRYTWSSVPALIFSFATDTPIYPEVTGFEEDSFSWMYNDNFEEGMMPKGFLGSIYLDINNGVISFVIRSSEKKQMDLDTLEYRTDVEPIMSRFEIIQNIKNAYWKADFIGSSNFGPSSYFLKGFVVLANDATEQIRTGFDFKEVDIFFEPGLDPSVTGFSEFDWYKSNEFTAQILTNKFIGKVYFDMTNGMIYLDVENM